MNQKRKKIILVTVVALTITLIISITYATLSQQLKILGRGRMMITKWDIHFENLKIVSLKGTAKEITKPTIYDPRSTKIGNYEVMISTPGDNVSYTFDVVNAGDYDAVLGSNGIGKPICVGLATDSNQALKDQQNVCNQLHYTLTYNDNSKTPVIEGDSLNAGETKTMILTLYYEDFKDYRLLPKEKVSINNLGFDLIYLQSSNIIRTKH